MAENRGDVIRGVIIMSLVLTVIVIPLRIYTRTFVRKGFGWDDVFAVIAFVSCWT
jgi:TRAP-type C4-dicarboxylate transport system permease small subunit